ncbi:MAG: MFS transporter [Treponema sp.]|jgi:fucose permease|nr:MFS transporter [Treponema sp.]
MISMLLLVIIYISFISMGLQDSLLGSAWPSMYTTLNVPLHFLGFISMTYAAGTVIASVFSEKIIKRLGTGLVVAISVLMTAAALMGFSFTSRFALLFLWAALLGLGGGSLDAALNNYVAVHYKAIHMNWLHCFWGVGASVGPIVMSFFLINKNSWNIGYRTISLIQCSLVAVLFSTLFLWGKIKSPVNDRNGRDSKSIPFKEIFSTVGVKQVLVAFFCYCTVEATTLFWGSSFLVMEKNIPPEKAAQWLSLFFIGITAGRFISGFMTFKFNNRQMIRLGQSLIVCGIAALILPVERVLLLPGFFMIGFGCAPIFPSLIHETPKNFGVDKSQAIVGIQMACAYIGSTLMPPFFGLITSFFSFKTFPIFIGIMLALCILMTETLNKKVEKNRA